MRLFDGLRRLKPGGPPRVDRTYAGLRSMALTLDPSKLGPVADTELQRVYGVVVDWSLGEDFATFVALADRTASLYTSRGGGTIGAAGRPAIDAAGARLLRTAEANLEGFLPVDGPEPPVVGAVRYWALTRGGLVSAGHDASGPPADTPGLQALGDAFQDYVTAFRIVDEEDRRPAR